MLEKILTKLKAQQAAINAAKGANAAKSNLSERSLRDLAEDLVSVITTDEILEKADFTRSIKSWDGNLNHNTASAVEADRKLQLEESKKTAEELLKKETAKKAAELKAEEDKKNGKPVTDPVIAQFLEQNKLIMEQLQGIKTEGVTQTRSELLATELKETPVIFRDATLKGFDRMTFKTDDEFAVYLGEIKESSAAAIQVGKENNLNTHTPSADITQPDPEGVSPEMAKAIEDITKVDKEEKPF